MADTIKMGTILIKEGTPLPEALRFESEPCAPGWSDKRRRVYKIAQSVFSSGRYTFQLTVTRVWARRRREMKEVSHKSDELSRETANEAKLHAGLVFKIPEQARILIVSDNDSDAKQLDAFFRDAGFIPETARSITAACECARSDRFRVIFSSPTMRDGSWKRLIDIANHYDLGFEVVLLACNFDLADWMEALTDGAFDVVDVVRDLSRAAEIAKRAFWAAYLKGAGPCPEVAGPRKAA